MKVLIIQPPLVQLNTPYPSGAYLSAFFRNMQYDVTWYDLSIKLFYEIFSRKGLTKLFSLCTDRALLLATDAERNNDMATAFNLRRYVSESDLWINWIDTITAILHGNESTRELRHQFAFGAFTPRGARMEKYLSELSHDLTTDDAFSLASFALTDIADFITTVFDSAFSLIRYAENLTVNETSFARVAQGADSPILTEFYIPLLKTLFPKESSFITKTKEPTLICISAPFAGTFAASLATGRFFKQQFGETVFISLGGGFINTELRETEEPALCNYIDAMSYDRGYGSYKALIDSTYLSTRSETAIPPDGLYKIRLFSNNKIINPKEHDKQLELFENELTGSLIPDYRDIDFGLYPRMADDTNPMHRLWNDGAWIKAYLAHGCYWHRCAFCDTTLDYVHAYQMTQVKNLYDGLFAQAQQKRIYGIHFVDEAAPPVALVQFAKENLKHDSKLNFWGNIRFEKTYTRDIADFLAAGGLIGVSGGIEIATGNGLEKINKGTNIDSIVASCCAFKEAGILVHAYMIYGYWSDTEQSIIDSMETLRQFFEAGLLDSAFWHKFVLTRHSTVYKEWQQAVQLMNNKSVSINRHLSQKNKDIPDIIKLHPIEPKGNGIFAKNGLHFANEQQSEKFGAPLDSALEDWMHGENLSVPVQQYFSFKVPAPRIPKDYISQLVKTYETARNCQFNAAQSDTIEKAAVALITKNSVTKAKNVPIESSRVYWLGGKLYPLNGNKQGWIYMGEEYCAQRNAPPSFYRGKGLCILPDWPNL